MVRDLPCVLVQRSHVSVLLESELNVINSLDTMLRTG